MGRFAHILSICGVVFLAGIGGPDEVRADAGLAILDEINALRRQHGLAPVRLEPRLTVEARAHARDMARHDYLDTHLPNGDKFETRLNRAGYTYKRMFVKLAAGFPTPLGVVARWASQKATRRQLLDKRFADVGLGYAAKPVSRSTERLDHFWVLTLAEPSRAFRGDWRREILRRVNAFRSGHGLGPLRIDRRLSVAAQYHADDMASRDYFDHVSPDGGTHGERASRAGYRWRMILENLAAGQPTPAEAVEGWKDSPGHRRAMLNPEIREMGIGYTYLPQDRGRVKAVHYWAMSMGRR
ncbi:MAG: CAP domain-containing protein [Alphaproteobacteria bacterium]